MRRRTDLLVLEDARGLMELFRPLPPTLLRRRREQDAPPILSRRVRWFRVRVRQRDRRVARRIRDQRVDQRSQASLDQVAQIPQTRFRRSPKLSASGI